MSSTPTYSVLAPYYDQLHADAARMNRTARTHILGAILPRVGSVCDLGCGTGTTALELAQPGRKVYAVDRSPAMCRIARAKVRRSGLPVRVICADLRAFRLPDAVDLVTCEFNPLNHLPRRADLVRAFRAVARALRPGGYFYFDVNTRRTFEKMYPSTYRMERAGFFLVMHGRYDPGQRKGRLDFDCFVRRGNFWRRRREHLEDIWWTDAEIRTALRRAGFRRIRGWDGADVRPRTPGRRRGYDTFYLAQKVRSSRLPDGGQSR